MRAIVYAEKGALQRDAAGRAAGSRARARTGPGAACPGRGEPHRLESAGVIDALGEGVPGLAAGDQVWVYLGQHGLPFGTAAEYCVVDWCRVVRLPDSLAGAEAFDLGASLGVPAVTAHRAPTSGPRGRSARC
jgi:NADPH2:quinone reductase